MNAVSIFLSALTIFIVLTRPKRRQAYTPPPSPDPVCGCRHHHSFHDPVTGVCAALDRVASEWGWSMNTVPRRIVLAYADQGCTCRHYVGPMPISVVYAPEMTDQVAYGRDTEARTPPDADQGPSTAS
jgi:hypothetical protein